jgi:hypothetical protein
MGTELEEKQELGCRHQSMQIDCGRDVPRRDHIDLDLVVVLPGSALITREGLIFMRLMNSSAIIEVRNIMTHFFIR